MVDEHDPTRTTRGRERLLAWQKEDPSRTQSFVAKSTGVDQSTAHRWFAGDTRPKLGAQREALFVLTGIRPEEWLTDEERAKGEEAVSLARKALSATPLAAEPASPAEAS